MSPIHLVLVPRKLTSIENLFEVAQDYKKNVVSLGNVVKKPIPLHRSDIFMSIIKMLIKFITGRGHIRFCYDASVFLGIYSFRQHKFCYFYSLIFRERKNNMS